MQEDNYRHKGMRKNMVEDLRNKGISDKNVLNAINNVPRHVFLDSSFIIAREEVCMECRRYPTIP